jgi:hypothetical protein
MTTRDELISAGYTSDGVQECPKCHNMIEILESPNGRQVRLNPPGNEDRSGWLHQSSCGKDPVAEFERGAISEVPQV